MNSIKRLISILLTICLVASSVLTVAPTVLAENISDTGPSIQYRSRSKIYTESSEELSEPWILYDTKSSSEHTGMRTTIAAQDDSEAMSAMYSACKHGDTEYVNWYFYTNYVEGVELPNTGFYATEEEFNAMDAVDAVGYRSDGKTYYRYTYCTSIDYYTDYYYYMWSDWTAWGDTVYTPDDDTEVETREVYTVSYNANGGINAPEFQYKEVDKDLTLSYTIPTRDEYVFIGWSTSSSGAVEYSDSDTYSENANVTLYAVWKSLTDFETVTTLYRYREKIYTTSTKLLDYPWILYDEETEYEHTDFEYITKPSDYSGMENSYCIHDKTYMLRYVNQYNSNQWFYATPSDFMNMDGTTVLTYSSDGTSYYRYKYCTSKEPYEVYYYYSRGAWSEWSETPIVETDDVEVETKLVVELYAITYDANGGSGAPAKEIKETDQTILLSEAIPTKENHKFLGWSTYADGNVEYYPGDEYSTNSDITLYAVWQAHIYDNACDVDCNVCGNFREAEHSYGEWITTEEATCVENGSKYKKCSICDNIVTESISATGEHDYNAFVTSPTCTAQGYTTHVCSVCGDSYIDSYLDASGHNYDNDCDTDCNVCGENREITHSYGAWTKVDDNDHKRTCTCGEVETQAHNWNDGTVTTQPTHTAYGEKTYTCDDCSATKTEQVDKITEHSYSSWTKVDDNSHSRTCICGEVEIQAHNWDDGTVTLQPTDTTYGEKTYTCIECLATKTEQMDKVSEVTSGACGRNLKWTLYSNGVLIISGTGDMYDYKYWNNKCTSPWDAWKSSIKTVIVEDGVTSIGAHAFYTHQNSLKKVEIAGTVSDIGDYAFYQCYSLTELIITEGVTTIGESAFQQCSFTTLTIPNSVTTISDNAFYRCEKLTDINLGKNIKEIGNYAFTNLWHGIENIWCSGSYDDYSEYSSNTLVGLNYATWHYDNCFGVYQEQSHTYSDWTNHDDTQHKKSCECGDVVYAEHIWNDGVVAEEPTHITTGIMIHTCIVCNTEKTAIISEQPHEFGKWLNVSETEHSRTCACGESETEPHQWDDGEITTQPTHTATGIKTYTCTDCEVTKTEIVETISKHAYGDWEKYSDTQHKQACKCGDVVYEDHVWDEGEVTTQPTHTTTGLKIYTCSDCGAIKTEVVSKMAEHTVVIDSAIAPTCTKSGLTEGQHCSVCGEILVTQNVVIALGHNYLSTVTAPACTEQGFTTHACSHCQDTYVDTYVDALDHNFSNYISDCDATCTADGTKTAICDRCDKTNTVADIGSALGHDHVATVTDPTCTQQGYTTHVCSRCQDTYVDTYTDALNHSFTNYISNDDATCTVDGTKTAKCDRCEVTDTVVDVGSANGHTPGTAATCTESKKCTVCQVELNPALGHNHVPTVTDPTCTEQGYTTHVCIRCQDTYVDTYTDALNHSFTNYISNNDATCIADGTKTAKCDRCELTDTVADVGSALGHSFTNYISNGDATCTADGTKTAKCDRCEVTDTVADVGSANGHTPGTAATCTEVQQCTVCNAELNPALGHNHVATVTAPSCTEQGYTTHVCSRCQDTYVDTYTDALNHSFTNYISNGDATTEADGTKTAVCDHAGCDETDTVTDIGSKIPYIPGDTNGDDVITDADAIHLLYHTLLPDLYPVEIPCDYNGDGAVTDADAVYLLYHTLLPDLYPLN